MKHLEVLGVALRAWLTTSPETRRRANRFILSGLALGVLGIVMAFSYPGLVAFIAGQALIVCGVAFGRTLRHVGLAGAASAAIWSMPWVFGAINAISS